MTGAAPRICKNAVVGLVAVLAAATMAGHLDRAFGAARTPSAPRVTLPASLQALEVGPVLARSVTKQWLLVRRSRGLTAIVADPVRLGPSLFRRVRTAGRSADVRVLVPIPVAGPAAGAATCRRLRLAGAACVLLAPTTAAATKLSQIPGALVIVRLTNLAAFHAFAKSRHGRIMGIVPLRLSAGAVAWQEMIGLARSNATLDLAIAPATGAKGAKSLARFERLLTTTKSAAGVDSGTGDPGPGGGGGTGGGGDTGGGGGTAGGGGTTDTLAPSTPLGLAKTGGTASSISVSWPAASDNVGVTGYGLYLAGASAGSTPQTSASFVGLTCGTSYTIAVDAFDAAGNRSGRSSATFSTSACGGGGSDTQAPTPPGGLRQTGVTTSSVSLAWNASTDNVGVAGYYLSRGGTRVATTSSLSYSFTGLDCGTTYVLGLSAFDLAGNTSNPALATVVAATSACAPPPPPPPPPPSGGSAAVFVAAGGSDANPCTATAQCRSFDRAYRVAAPGAVVQVAGGNYPIQIIGVDPTKTSQSDVVFTPAPGATVTIACDTTATIGGATIGGQSCLDVFASHITFDGGASKAFQTQTYSVGGFSYQGRIDTERTGSDITFRNMDIGAVAVGSSTTTVSHNDLGPSVDPLNIRQAGGDGNVWQDNLIHDFLITNGGHMECVTWDAGTNITFEYNEFRSCEVFSIFAKPTDNISGKIDHNVFWNPAGVTTNDDVKVSLGSGATRCDVATTNNWISEDTYMDCPGATESGTTTHSPTAQPPSPIRP